MYMRCELSRRTRDERTPYSMLRVVAATPETGVPRIELDTAFVPRRFSEIRAALQRAASAPC